MKENIIKLLESNSFDDYLKGVECLKENINTANLTDSELNQDIIERACAIFILEKWAQQDDYIEALQKFIDVLPNYSSFLSHDDIGHHIKGIALFINGLGEGRNDVSGFLYQSHSGYLMSNTAAVAIKVFFNSQNNTEGEEFFNQLAQFFERINSAQFGVAQLLTKIETWNVSMITGFFNILTSSDFSIQSWMLGSLYNVVQQPIVKEQIFDKYIAVLKNVQNKYKEETNSEKLEQVNSILEMVITKSKGE